MAALIIIYVIFILLVAAYVAINTYNLVRFRLDRLDSDRSRAMMFTYLAVVIIIFFVSIIGAIISYNL